MKQLREDKQGKKTDNPHPNPNPPNPDRKKPHNFKKKAQLSQKKVKRPISPF